MEKKTWADLINGWISEKSSRSVTHLAEATDVSKSKIYDLIKGESASLEVAWKLGRVLSPDEIVLIMADEQPLFSEFLGRLTKHTDATARLTFKV